MISTTITINSISQYRRYTQILKAKRVLHLLTNTDSYPYTISFTTRSTKQTNNNLKKTSSSNPPALCSCSIEG